jgi:copper(I)-binding protein
MKVKYLLFTGVIFTLSMLAAGCSLADDLSVSEAWARSGSQGANSAVYFTIENNTADADTLLSASSEIASAVELHESMTQTVDQGQGMLSKPAVDHSDQRMAEHHPGGVMAEMDCEHDADHPAGMMAGAEMQDCEQAQGTEMDCGYDADHPAGMMAENGHVDCEQAQGNEMDCEHDTDRPAGMMAEAGHEDCDQAQGTEMDCQHDADHPAGMMAEAGYMDCEHTEGTETDCELGDHEAMQAEGYQEHHDMAAMAVAADTGSAMGVSMDSAVMVMVPRENVPVKAGSQVAFQPGGLHVMLVGLQQDLQPGDHFTITLNFEKAGPVSLDVAVREP